MPLTPKQLVAALPVMLVKTASLTLISPFADGIFIMENILSAENSTGCAARAAPEKAIGTLLYTIPSRITSRKREKLQFAKRRLQGATAPARRLFCGVFLGIRRAEVIPSCHFSYFVNRREKKAQNIRLDILVHLTYNGPTGKIFDKREGSGLEGKGGQEPERL